MIIEEHEAATRYHVFTASTLQAALSDCPASDTLSVALELAEREPIPQMPPSGAIDAPIGTPIVEKGRVLGVRASDAAELVELTEADLEAEPRTKRTGLTAEGEAKSGLLDRLKRPRGKAYGGFG